MCNTIERMEEHVGDMHSQPVDWRMGGGMTVEKWNGNCVIVIRSKLSPGVVQWWLCSEHMVVLVCLVSNSAHWTTITIRTRTFWMAIAITKPTTMFRTARWTLHCNRVGTKHTFHNSEYASQIHYSKLQYSIHAHAARSQIGRPNRTALPA